MTTIEGLTNPEEILRNAGIILDPCETRSAREVLDHFIKKGLVRPAGAAALEVNRPE